MGQALFWRKDHDVHIQVKGPKWGGFVEWGDDYEDDADLRVEVSNATGAKWGTTTRPYSIHDLHGNLSRRDKKLRPTFTVNAGKFDCYDEIVVDFERDVASDQPKLDQKTYSHVVARIILEPGQEAELKGGKELPTIKLSGTKWDILVTNSPTLEHVCDGFHFLHYYKGFEMSNGSDVPDNKKYKAKGDYDECIKGKITPRAIPSRPCIPISY